MELTFIHIPKNAGTSISRLGRDNGYQWSWEFDYSPYKKPPWKGFQPNCSGWHIPPKMFKHNAGYDIYFNNKQPFCVTRNPYTRVISEYMYCRTRPQEAQKTWGVDGDINSFIAILPTVKPAAHDCRLLPASEYTYVYNVEANTWEQQTENNKQIEILSIENLQEEFDNLMNKYNCSITGKLPVENESDERITVEDLTKESIHIINTIYHADFINFGYKKRQRKFGDTGCFLEHSADADYFDGGLAQAILTFLKDRGSGSLVDIGCGFGQYVHFFNQHNIDCIGYDGNPLTGTLAGKWEFAKDKCYVKDLSVPCTFDSQSDWGLCLEVGEHIPKEYEDIFLNNLHACNKQGLILSWAVPGQGGTGHVNEQPNDYIKERLASMGYVNDSHAESFLRKSSKSLPWFANTLMVFTAP